MIVPMTHDHRHPPAEPVPHADDPTTHWEARYGEQGQIWSGTVNPTTAAVVAGLPVGTALDLGCGEGGDVLWMAEQGWQVTGVDISATAISRGQAAAESAGLDGQITWVAADLSTWTPTEQVDLVTASFFHSMVDLPRTEILRRAAGAVAPGGHLVIVSHGAPPPWSQMDHHPAHHHLLPSAEAEVQTLDLGSEWTVEVAESRMRDAVGPDGQQAELDDLVVVLRRA